MMRMVVFTATVFTVLSVGMLAGQSIQAKLGGNADESFYIINADGDTVGIIRGDGQMGLGTGQPAAGAALDVSSTTGALLLPRLTAVQRDALTPAEGMMIYNTDNGEFQGYAEADIDTVTDISHQGSATCPWTVSSTWSSGGSWTAGSSDTLVRIDIMMYAGSAYSPVMHVYAGDGPGGTELHSQTVSFPNTNDVETWISIHLSTGIALTSGSQYTVYFTTAAGSGSIVSASDINDAGGQVWQNGSTKSGYDLQLKTYVLQDGPGWVSLH